MRRWLERQGWDVRAEVRDCDLLGRTRDEHGVPLVHAVELKLWATEHLLKQARWRSYWANYVTVAVPIEPHQQSQFFGNCKHFGYGLLVVTPDSRVRVKLKPRPQPWQWHRMRKVSEKHLERVWSRCTRQTGGVSPKQWKAMK